MSLAFATVKDLKEKLEKKEISKDELLNYFINRFKKFDDKIGSALEIFSEESILQKSNASGSLNGIPGIIKDNICQEGRITSCASKILENFRSTFDSTAVKKLKEQGALLIGRANCDEFAMGSSNEYSAFKRVANPWDLQRVAGGSSGGPVAAVAAGLIPWSLGSDTGGSVRLPSAFCGTVAIKPTYGHVSRYGLVAYGSSLDQIGVITRTVYDNALIFSEIAGHDPKDSSSLNVKPKDYTANLKPKFKENLKIGIVKNSLESENIDNEIKSSLQAAIKKFEELGASIKYIDFKSLNYSIATYFIISRAEAASNLARFDGVRYGYRNQDNKNLVEMYEKTRGKGFGPEVRLRILVGNYVLSAGHADEYYVNANKVRQMMKNEANEIFNDVDLLLLPTHVTPAFKFGTFNDPLAMDLQDYFTAFVNLIGVPAMAFPCGFTKSNLPIGCQLVGKHFSEELLYNTAYAYEQSTDWHKKRPKGFED